ncbi:MAG: PAS domain S-box protein [Chitinophagales bacterium]
MIPFQDKSISKIDRIHQLQQENEKIKEQLAHAHSLLEATIESTTDGLLVVSTKGEMLQFNQKFLDMWQISREMMDGEGSIIDYLLPQIEEPEKFVKLLSEIYDNLEATSFDMVYFRDGRIFERYSQPQKIGSQIVGRVWSFRDVTQKVQTEKELRESEFLFRSLFEESPIGIVIDVHKKNKLVRVNNKFAKMMGYSMEELANMTAKDITYSEDLYNYKPGLNSVVANKGMDCNFEKRYKTKEGEMIWGDVSLSVVRQKDNSVTHKVVMIQDITEKKKTLIELKQKATELNEKNKELKKYIGSNMQLENFAYIASHDLREPLLTIMGLVDILIEDYAEQLDEEASSFLKFIEQCAKNMELLINDLFAYACVDTQEHTVTDFNMEELLQKVMNGLQKTIEEQKANIQFTHIPQNLIANETKMLQLFQNLIANAIKFQQTDKTPIIKISATDEGNYWQFSVSDNGIGIAPQHQEKIFLLFKKLHNKSEYRGTGIGLATCKKIAEQHGGKIWLESELNKGTTFYFTICKDGNNHCK